MFLKKFFYVAVISAASAVSAFGQTSTKPEPTPTPFQSRPETGVERVRRLDRQFERIQQETFANLYGQNPAPANPEWREKMIVLYGEPDDSKTRNLEPAAAVIEKYRDFLEEKDTGVFKIIPEQGCETETGSVVSAAPVCLEYNFPGAGSSYSFRTRNYRIRRLADITLVKNSLAARGVFSGAIFVALGDVPIETIDLKTPGLRFLENYKPVKTAREALEAAKQIAGGIKKDGFIYGRGIFVTADNTFAMRSIAYDGEFQRSEAGVVYNELDFDKRRDIIVAFRIVEVEENGSATIVYKILREMKSPKLKTEEK